MNESSHSLSGRGEHLKAKIIENLFALSWWSIFYNPFHITRRKLYRMLEFHRNAIGGKVLDFGCGSKPYQRVFKCESYVGCDIMVSGHDHSNEEIDLVYDGITIPCADQSFDSIFTSEVIEHVFNPDRILNELKRVLVPGGTMMLSCPFFWAEHEMPFDYCRYSSAGIKSLLERNGFEVEFQTKLGNRFSVFFQLLNIFVYDLLTFHPKAWLLGLPLFGSINLLESILGRFQSRDSLYLSNFLILKKVPG
jgi:SAM-dependent methyltransferase